MTKKQKIWFWVFIAIFAIPEIIWSPITSYGYELLQGGNTNPLRENLLTDLHHMGLTNTVMILQVLGILFALKVISTSSVRTTIKWLAIIILTVLLLVSVTILYFDFALSRL